MVRSARDWPWSSYRATAGESKALSCLAADWLLATFGQRKSVAIERYMEFIARGKSQSSPWESLRNQIYLGSEVFVEKMQSQIDGDKELGEVPSAQHRPHPKRLDEYEAFSSGRNSAMAMAYQGGGYTLKEIGDYFGLHYSTVSGILKDQKSKT